VKRLSATRANNVRSLNTVRNSMLQIMLGSEALKHIAAGHIADDGAILTN
jgi:hypothetical protein